MKQFKMYAVSKGFTVIGEKSQIPKSDLNYSSQKKFKQF